MDAQLRAEFLCLYRMALADGVVDARELETLYRIGTEQYGVGQAEIIDCVKNAGNADLVMQDSESRIRLLYNMARIAWADGSVDPTERMLLEKYVSKLGFDDNNRVEIANFLLGEAERGQSVENVLEHIKA